VLAVEVKRRQGLFHVDVSFAANGNGVTALYGRSGAGKTSVINMVAGLLRPDDGRIAANGRAFFDSARGIDLPVKKRRIGYIFQDGRLFPHLSVRSNLMYGMNLVPRDARYVDFDQVVELLGIEQLLSRRPARLSGGEKQRVAIGRALLASPLLLLMDEPLASLDGERKAELLTFIAKLPTEFSIPILYVSHSVQEILALSDNLVIIEAGRVVVSGATEQVMPQFDLRSCEEHLDLALDARFPREIRTYPGIP
jgi:molybdate transport system ATP-binding protein